MTSHTSSPFPMPSLLLSVLLGVGTLSAQTADQPGQAATSLAKTCAQMQDLVSLKFETVEDQDAAMMRRFRHMMPDAAKEKELAGRVVEGSTWLDLSDSDQEVVVAHGRAIAREIGGAWRPRRGLDAFGKPLPFVFDPQMFFERLHAASAAGKDVRTENATWRGAEYTVHTLTLDEDAARDFVLGGAVPAPQSMGGAMMIGGNVMGGGDLPELLVDVAVWIDAKSGLCHRVKVNVQQDSNLPDNVRFEFQGAEGLDDAPEAEDVTEFDADGKRIYRHGLPVRKLEESVSAMRFEARLSEHGTAAKLDLDDEARALLGVGRKR
ncbi:MAG: hypothetical protein AB7I19_03855 [Planctomycetota bacterium]